MRNEAKAIAEDLNKNAIANLFLQTTLLQKSIKLL
jgi:hypothetical protein